MLMTQVDSSFGYVNFGFEPKLHELLTGEYALFAETHGIKDVGMPVFNSDRSVDVAVWHTTVPNFLGELGVLSVRVPRGEMISPTDKQWYCGMIPGDVYDLAVQQYAGVNDTSGLLQNIDTTTMVDTPSNPNFASELIDFANTGAYSLTIYAGELGAFDLLQLMYRC